VRCRTLNGEASGLDPEVLHTAYYPIPTLSPTVWTMVVVPLIILVYPTAADRHGYWYGSV
jgi:hypothetical protein